MGSAQSIGGIGVRRHPRRRDSEQNSGQQGSSERKSQHRQRRRGTDGHMLVVKCQPQNEAGAPERESHSHDSAEQCQDRALRQYLQDLPRSAARPARFARKCAAAGWQPAPASGSPRWRRRSTTQSRKPTSADAGPTDTRRASSALPLRRETDAEFVSAPTPASPGCSLRLGT